MYVRLWIQGEDLSGQAKPAIRRPCRRFDGGNTGAYSPRVTTRRIWIARGLAVAADLIQIVLAPLFFAGGLSVFDALLDVAMAGILSRLVGWHWAFLPAFLVELAPGVDLAPSWTLAVFLATRRRMAPEASQRDGRVIDVEPVREHSPFEPRQRPHD